MSTGGVNVIDIAMTRPSGSYKIAVKYNASGVELWVNGSKIDATSTGNLQSSGITSINGRTLKGPYGIFLVRL